MEARSWLMTASPDHDAQDPERAGEEEHDVEPDLPRLQTAPDPAQPARQSGAPIHRRAIHEALVDHPPEQHPGNPEHRPDDEAIIELIDVVLVVDHPPEPRLGSGLKRRHDVR